MGLAAKRDFSVSSTAYSSFATPIPIALGEVPDAPTAYAGFRLAAEVAVVVVVAAGLTPRAKERDVDLRALVAA
jgi:hypothetical protein